MKYLWKLQDAKSKFSQLIQDAVKKGPQFITRHGKETAVIISMEEYHRLMGKYPDFKDFLLSAPRSSDGLKIPRDRSKVRDFTL